jgi:hypothetical protein
MGFETLAFPLLVVERETDRRQRRLAPKPPRACAIRGCSSSLLLALLWISAERDRAASALSVQWGSMHEKQRPESLLAASANVSLFFSFLALSPIAPSMDGDDVVVDSISRLLTFFSLFLRYNHPNHLAEHVRHCARRPRCVG